MLQLCCQNVFFVLNQHISCKNINNKVPPFFSFDLIYIILLVVKFYCIELSFLTVTLCCIYHKKS